MSQNVPARFLKCVWPLCLTSEKPGSWKIWTMKILDYEKRGKQLLTQKGSVIDLWPGSKYASEGFFISVWFLLFHHTLLKAPHEVDLKWNPLTWNWLFFKNSFRWSKGLLHKKGEKLFVWSFSQCKKILFSKWFLSLFFFYIKDLKPVAVTYAFLQQIL